MQASRVPSPRDKALKVCAVGLDCKTVRIFAYSSTHEQLCLRHALPISLLILRKKRLISSLR